MDAYDLQARHAPAILTILPLVLLASLALPSFQKSLVLPSAFAATALAAIYALLSRVVRVKGRELQIRLFREWGGPPTTAMLRHRDTRINKHTKARYHERLRSLGRPFEMPTAREEAADATSADELYGAAVDELRRRAKASKNRAVLRENISFGFTRNLLAMRPFGIGVALASLAILAFMVWCRGGYFWDAIRPVDAIVGGLLILDLCAWLFLVTNRLVLHHAEAYAVALLETAEQRSARR
jgi:hypothetical protein